MTYIIIRWWVQIEEKFNIITFESTHEAMRCEKVLKDKGFKVRIIPLPSEISAGCGLSLKLNLEDYKEIIENLNKYTNNFKCYEIIKNGFNKKVTPI